MKIGDRIKQKRIELGLSQEELGKKMGYQSRNAIYQFEQKDNMKLSLVEKFAAALDTTPSYLMGWDEPNDFHIETDKATELYAQYEKLPPDKQAMFEAYLKFLQSDT